MLVQNKLYPLPALPHSQQCEEAVIFFFLSMYNCKLSHVMRKPVYAICEQQRCRSACASAQSDQCLCCSLPRYYNTSSFYTRNFKPLASLWSWAGQFESYLVKNPEGFVMRQCLQAFEEASAGIQIDADPELQSLKHVKTKEEERKRQEQLKRERKPKKNRKNYKVR